MDESVTLVTSGPEAGSATNRDTAVVVRDLFATAEQSVLVAGYAVYQGNRVFQALADRMQDRPNLKVRLFLNIRRDRDASSSNELVRRFADQFRRHQWPADRPLPEVYYFPQSIDTSAEKLATLHAKCVVVDRRTVFVSSANFTEAAQERNIEIGLLIHSTRLAEQIEGHFDSLQSAGVLCPVFS